MNFPDDLKYSKDHMWIKRDNEKLTMGITFFAQLELGDIAFVEIKKIGKHIQKDKVFGKIEAIKTVSDMFIPISGVIAEKNPLLVNDPALINKDPYEAGWIIHFIPDDLKDLDELLTAHQYKKLVNG